MMTVSRVAPRRAGRPLSKEAAPTERGGKSRQGGMLKPESEVPPGTHVPTVSHIHVGPGELPSCESPEAALDLLRTGGHGACEIDFGFWMDWEFARRLAELAGKAGVRLSLQQERDARQTPAGRPASLDS